LGAWTFLQIPLGTATGALLAYVPGAAASSKEARNVAHSSEHGVNPRKEILWELAFLLPPLGLAGAAALLMGQVPSVRLGWGRLLDPGAHPLLVPHLVGLGSALFGYLIGGLWVWATRILGTLAFDKEAMGMGDVHILAAVGAVTGWIVPSIAFFVAPFLGLLWAIHLLLGRKQHEVPYGPWLAAATAAVLLGYDRLTDLLHRHAEGLTMILR
jgi:leader peptidase (prepilin peptidase)/N-methyltransferase